MSSVLTKHGSPPRGWLSLRLGSSEYVFFLLCPERGIDGARREAGGLGGPLGPTPADSVWTFYEAPLQAEPGLSSLIWGFLKVGKAAWPSLLRASPQP